MPREVKSSDFTDAELEAFFGRVTSLKVSALGGPPPWIRREAVAFAEKNPKPDYDELRQQIDHSVAVARGWDHPWDHHEMFTMAVKAYYLLAWLGHLQGVVERRGQDTRHLDLSFAYKMTFTPVFRDGPPPL